MLASQGSATRESVMRVQSLHPELEFEVIKLILLRESYLRRLDKTLVSSGGKVDIGVVGMADTLRDVSLEVVETIQEWERSQLDYPTLIKPFIWNGEEYLAKMRRDYGFLQAHANVGVWLGFDPTDNNPFIIPPEAYNEETPVLLADNSFVVFGTRPPVPSEEAKRVAKAKFIKSPYLTPILNDLRIFPELSALNKIKKELKTSAAQQDVAAAATLSSNARDKAVGSVGDPFETYLSSALIKRAQTCWKIMHQALHRNNTTLSLASSMSISGTAGGDVLSKSLRLNSPSSPSSPHALGSRLEEASFELTGGGGFGVTPLGAIQEHERSYSSRDDGRGGIETLPQPPSYAAVSVGELDGNISRVSATSVFSKTRDEFSATSLGFHASLAETGHSQPLPNKAMRLEDLSQISGPGGSVHSHGASSVQSSSRSSVKTWTPHEVKLQKTVQKRGGELFVLTAAGTRGRIKAPWRKTRFQRLEHDLEKLRMQGDMVSMALEESTSKVVEVSGEIQDKVQAYIDSVASTVATEGAANGDTPSIESKEDLTETAEKVVDPKLRKLLTEKKNQVRALLEMKKAITLNHDLLDYQLHHFRKLVDGGNLTALDSLRKRHLLPEGEALESDNLISMSVEDQAATVIQRTCRKAFSKALRRLIIRKRNLAAIKIQGFVRKKKNEGQAYYRAAKLMLVGKLQKIWRGRGVRNVVLSVRQHYRERLACAVFQRLVRGFLARRRTRRKRMFLTAVYAASKCVTLDTIAPDDVESLGDAIENFLTYYDEYLPMAVMSVLRGILYMFVGDDEESILVENQGYVDVRRFDAKTVTWFCLKQFLRRKGRFLRRLRALVEYVNFPGPCMLTFSKSCQIHLDEVRKHVREGDFEGMEDKPKGICINLLHYIMHMKTAFDLQSEFPDYFVPTTPNWYRLTLSKQMEYRRSEAAYLIAVAAREKIDTIRDEYKREGRRWGHVYAAEVQNAHDIADTKAALEKAADVYKTFVAKFVSDEKHEIALFEGLEKARAMGLQVAQRDFAEYINRNGDGDEKVVAMYRLNVDKKSLALLEIQTKLIKLKEMRAVNEAARNFKKLIRLKHIKAVARNSGALLGRMMVLQEVWTDFLLQIGGVQYVADLTGKKKELYENIRREILELIQGRRTLNKDLEQTIRDQIKRCRKISHDKRVERTKLYWDNPTFLEKDAEHQEDFDCSKRDADREGKAQRMAKLVKIPLGVRKPILLIIDIRIPKILRSTLVAKLKKIKFELVEGYISDPTIAIPSQRLLDAGLNLIVFVDRGIHGSARAAFLGFFNAYIHSLVPFPRIIALDATLQLRYENWFSDFSPNMKELFNFSIEGSADCGLMLGRLRRTAFIFRMCLLLESNEEDRQEGATLAAPVPDWLRARFRIDLDDFMDEVHGDRDGDDAMSASSSMEKSGMILVATISSIMGIWKAPLLPWKEKQIQDGCNAFCERVLDAPKLCEMLWLNPLPLTTQTTMERLKVARGLAPAWRGICRLAFYKHPARYLLARWCLETMDLMDQLLQQGGGVDEQFKFLPVSYVQQLDWIEDVCDSDTRADRLVGELLQASLSASQVYETEAAVVEYEKIDSITDTTRQYFSSRVSKRKCRVYYSGSDCYLAVTVERAVKDKRRGRRGNRKEVRNYFSHMDILDVITMLQPNFTEIYEGRMQRYVIDGPKKKHDWWELLATWGRLEKVGKKFHMSLLRSRYLMSSSIGYLNGYLCRFEVFEERYAEILILIHGLPGVGTIYYSANRKEITKLLPFADEVEEKIAIENYDAQTIASIFADRLTAKPSFVKNWFLSQGELQPKSLEKKVQVYLRTSGGPGRFVGRKLIKLQRGLLVLVTIFEITNSSEIYGLRIVIHELKHQQTAEYRLSSLERVSLFSEEIPMVDQIISRIRIVYCDLRDPGRTILALEPSYSADINQDEVLVEGQFEYDLFTASELLEMKHRGDDARLDGLSIGGGSEEASLTSFQQVRPQRSQVSKLDSLETRDQGWGWGLYLNRYFVEESRGNLMVSATLVLSKKGFAFAVLDNRTMRESFRFMSFEEALRFLRGERTMDQFSDELRNIEQATVYDLIDDLYSYIAFSPLSEIDGIDVSDYEVNRLALSKGDRHYSLAYCRIREVGEELDPEKMASRLAKFSIRKAAVYVLAARELTAIGGVVVARNPFAIVKWNSREAGRTTPSRNDLNPEWEDPPMLMQSTKDKKLPQCILEIDVWDWNVTTLRPADYLGGIKLTGEALVSFLEAKELKTIQLERSKRMTDADNKNVGGSIVIFGVLDGDIANTYVPQDYRDDTDRVEAEKKKREEELANIETARLAAEYKAKGGMLGGFKGMFGSSKKAPKTEQSTVDVNDKNDKKDKKVSMEAPSSLKELSKMKFSERHKITDPANYLDAPTDESALAAHLDFLQVAPEAVEEEDEKKLGDSVDLPGDAAELDRLRAAYAAPVSSEEEELSLADSHFADDDQSAVISLDHTIGTGGNELYSLADRTVTDDSMTLAGYAEARHITLQFISAEGLPIDLSSPATQWVVRFNGFMAAEVGGRMHIDSPVERVELEQVVAERILPKEDFESESGMQLEQASEEPWVEPTGPTTLEMDQPGSEIENGSLMRRRRLDVAGTVSFPATAVVDMHVPPFLELASCSIEVELWVTRLVKGLPERVCCGTADIRGSRLVAFIESRGYDSTWLTLYDGEGLPASSLNSFCDAVPMRVQLKGDSPIPAGPKVLKLDLSLRSVRNLWFSREAGPYGSRKTDTDSKKSEQSAKSSGSQDDSLARPTSIYVEVRFNEITIGSTPPAPDSFVPYPVWNLSGRFEIMVPSEMTLEQCKLELRLFAAVVPEVKKGKKKKKAVTTFLGAKVLEGRALCDFFDGIPGEPLAAIAEEAQVKKKIPKDASPLRDSDDEDEGEDEFDDDDSDEGTVKGPPQNLRSGALTGDKTMLYSLHPSPLFEQSSDSAAKIKIVSEQDMEKAVLEMKGKAEWVDEENWEMENDPSRAATEDALALAAPPTSSGDELVAFDPRPSSAEMMRRIGGIDYVAPGQGAPSPFGELPNSTVAGSVLDRPWSRLSRASMGRDIPEGQRPNAMADVQDMVETRLLLTLHEATLEAAALKSAGFARRLPLFVVGKIFFNEKCVGERIVPVTQSHPVEEPAESKEEQEAKEKLARKSRRAGEDKGNKEEEEKKEQEEQDKEAQEEEHDTFLDLKPAAMVLFIPRGQRLDSCTLEIQLLHKGSPVGHISIDSADLTQLMVLPAVKSLEQAAAQRKEQAELELRGGKSAKSVNFSPAPAPAPQVLGAPVPIAEGQDAPAVALSKEEELPPAAVKRVAEGTHEIIPSSYTIHSSLHGQGVRAYPVGSAKLSGAVTALDSAWDEARQRLNMGAAMHRRGAEDTQRRVQVKLLAVQGLSGSLKAMHSPRINGVAAYGSYGASRAAAAGEDGAPSELLGAAGGGTENQHAPPPSPAPPNKGNSDKTVYAVVKWNGQEIRRSEKVALGNDLTFKHIAPVSYSRDIKSKALEGSQCTNTFVMYVPRGHRLRGCYLEIVLWDRETCLGSTLLHGEDLTMFLEGYGSAREDIDFYSFYDPDDDIAQGHRSFPLQYSASVPQNLQGSVNGRIVLRGRVDPDPDPMARAAVQPRGGLDCPYPKIRTSLAPEALGWRRSFFPESSEEDMFLGASLETASVGALTVDSRADGIGQSRRKRGGAESGRHPMGVKFPGHAAGPLENFVQSIASDFVRNLFFTKFRCELAAVTFLKHRSKTMEEDRVCWRGRGMPSEVKGLSEAQRGAMFKSRSSRCVKRGAVNELRVMADIKFLEEVSGEGDALQAALPIIVKEIVSDGPGISLRVYRIEITTNAGASLGNADITNDHEIIRAVGAEHAAIFGNKGRAAWPMPEIFGHIVNARTKLDFAPPKKRGKAPAQSFMSMLKKKEADAPVSVINIVKDVEVPVEVVRFAMFGGTLGGLTLDELEAQRQAEEARKIQEEKQAAFRKELDKRKRERPAVPITDEDREKHRLEEEQWTQERLERKQARRTRRLEQRKRWGKRDASPKKSSEPENAPGSVEGPSTPAAASSSPSPRSPSPGRFGFGGLGNLVSKASATLSSVKAALNITESSIGGQEDQEAQMAHEREEVAVRAPREKWVRIHNLAHFMSGIKFRTVVLLFGMVPTLDTETDEFFETRSLEKQHELLAMLRVVIRAKDAYTAKVFEIDFTGQEILTWLGNKYKPDLRKKFRRMKFGEFLVSKMIMRFDSSRGYILDLMSEDMGSVKSDAAVAEKLRQLHEQAQAEQRSREAELDAALEAELRNERRQRWNRDQSESSEEEEEEEEVKTETRSGLMGNTGEAASKAAAAAAEAMRASAQAAGAALKGMFSWGGKKK